MSIGIPTSGTGSEEPTQEPGNIFEQYDDIMNTFVTNPATGFEPPTFESEPVLGGFIPHLPPLSPSMYNANGKVDMIVQDGYVANASVNMEGEWTFAHNFNYFHTELPVLENQFDLDAIRDLISPEGYQAPVPTFVSENDYLPLLRAAAAFNWEHEYWILMYKETVLTPRILQRVRPLVYPSYKQEYLSLPQEPSRIEAMLASPPASHHPGMGGGAGGN